MTEPRPPLARPPRVAYDVHRRCLEDGASRLAFDADDVALLWRWFDDAVSALDQIHGPMFATTASTMYSPCAFPQYATRMRQPSSGFDAGAAMSTGFKTACQTRCRLREQLVAMREATSSQLCSIPDANQTAMECVRLCFALTHQHGGADDFDDAMVM